jgi:hypothetical protein
MNHGRTPILLLLILALSVTACGGSEATSTAQPTIPPTLAPTQTPALATLAPTPTRDLDALSPPGLGEEIGGVYLEALQKATELVQDRPAVAEVDAQLAALKERYVQRLLQLGHRREALSDLDQAAVDNAINDTFIAGTKQEWYDSYFGAVQHYAAVDEAFQELLYSFNLLGQYARFDLLTEQEPGEAARLGVSTAPVAEGATPTAATPPQTAGYTLRNEGGGYSFRTVPDLVVEESGGTVMMNADGGDPAYGPAIILIGGPNEGHTSVEALYDSLLGDADDPQVSNRREITVGEVPAIAVDVVSQPGGEVEVTGRMAVALVEGERQFTAFGFAPTAQWPELEPLYEEVLASIAFFEPAADAASRSAYALGEERRSDYGGFLYRRIQGDEAADEGGMIGLFAPDGAALLSPQIAVWKGLGTVHG